MQTSWSFVDAKSKLNEVLDRAEREPQFIHHGDRQYVILNDDQYRLLRGRASSLKKLILQGRSLEGMDFGLDQFGSRESA